MKQSIGFWQICGFSLTSVVGTLLHYLYDWFGEAVFIAPFSGVNESTWEHMKLLFWPMFIFAVVQSFFFRDRNDFWCVKCRGIILGLLLIPVIYYTYNGAIGKSPDWLNISIFFVSSAASYIYESRLFNTKKIRCASGVTPVIVLSAVALSFVLFTFLTPKIGIFIDPLTGNFGI